MAGILKELRPLGFSPLASGIKGEVLKYNFKGIGKIVTDKSLSGNNGRLIPKENPPKRQIYSWFPLKVKLILDGSNSVRVPDDPSLDLLRKVKVTMRILDTERTVGYLLDKGVRNSDGGYGLFVGERGGGYLSFKVADGERTKGVNWAGWNFGETPVTVTGEYDRDKGVIRMLSDGEEVARESTDMRMVSTDFPLFLGRRADWPSQYQAAEIDYVSIEGE